MQRLVGGEEVTTIKPQRAYGSERLATTQPRLTNLSVHFDLDNVTAVQCIQRQGTATVSPFLALKEGIFAQASRTGLLLSAKYAQGRENDWVDALSRFQGTSVEWQLCSQVFEALPLLYLRPQVDLFTSQTTAQLPLYLPFSRKIEAVGPDAFTENWNRWENVYMFPTLATAVLLNVVQMLRSHRRRMLFIAAYWPAQPWFRELLRWCPSPLILGSACLSSRLADPSKASLRLQAWSFYGELSAIIFTESGGQDAGNSLSFVGAAV